jgi:hypothetical protein
MGSGKPRSNIVPLSAGSQVITGPGGGSVSCEIDDYFFTIDRALAKRQGVGTVVIAEHELALHLPGDVLAVLVPNDTTERLISCMARGYSFVGSFVGEGIVRIWNDRSS